MDVFIMWLAISIVAVVGEVLIFAAYVVHRTGSTGGLADIGQMVANIIAAFAKIVAAFVMR